VKKSETHLLDTKAQRETNAFALILCDTVEKVVTKNKTW